MVIMMAIMMGIVIYLPENWVCKWVWKIILFLFDGYNDGYNYLPIKNEFVIFLTFNKISKNTFIVEAHIVFIAYGKAPLVVGCSGVRFIVQFVSSLADVELNSLLKQN